VFAGYGKEREEGARIERMIMVMVMMKWEWCDCCGYLRNTMGLKTGSEAVRVRRRGREFCLVTE
jgi:hypothetical protein